MMQEQIKYANRGMVGALLGGAALLGAGGLVVHDTLESRKYPVGDLERLLKKNAVDSKKHVAEQDAKVQVITNKKMVRKYVEGELKDDVGWLEREAVIDMMAETIRKGNNAFALPRPTDEGDAVFLSKKLNPVVIDHELGHIKDFREKKDDGILPEEAYGGYGALRNLVRTFSKDAYYADTMAAEQAAWDHVKDSKEKLEVMVPAMNSYRRGFHLNRAVTIGAPTGGVVGGIAGAVVGSKLGGRQGRDIGIQAGSLLGSIAGAAAPLYFGQVEPGEEGYPQMEAAEQAARERQSKKASAIPYSTSARLTPMMAYGG